MYNYANKINVAANQDKTEVILSFVQESPQFVVGQVTEEGGSNMEATLQSTSIADIVVTGEFAKKIASLIMQIVED